MIFIHSHSPYLIFSITGPIRFIEIGITKRNPTKDKKIASKIPPPERVLT